MFYVSQTCMLTQPPEIMPQRPCFILIKEDHTYWIRKIKIMMYRQTSLPAQTYKQDTSDFGNISSISFYLLPPPLWFGFYTVYTVLLTPCVCVLLWIFFCVDVCVFVKWATGESFWLVDECRFSRSLLVAASTYNFKDLLQCQWALIFTVTNLPAPCDLLCCSACCK